MVSTLLQVSSCWVTSMEATWGISLLDDVEWLTCDDVDDVDDDDDEEFEEDALESEVIAIVGDEE